MHLHAFDGQPPTPTACAALTPMPTHAHTHTQVHTRMHTRAQTWPESWLPSMRTKGMPIPAAACPSSCSMPPPPAPPLPAFGASGSAAGRKLSSSAASASMTSLHCVGQRCQPLVIGHCQQSLFFMRGVGWGVGGCARGQL